MADEPVPSIPASRCSFLRENRWGRLAFLLVLLVAAGQAGRAMLWLRGALISAGGSAPDSLHNSFNVDGVAHLGARVASAISREWWEILAALVILGLAVAAVRFLDGVRPRASLRALGLRGGLPRGWRRLAIVPFLPPLLWLGYEMWSTEPRLPAETWTWKSYFLPFADLSEVFSSTLNGGGSARPVWWLSAGVGTIGGFLFTYGLVWRQLRRLGFSFAAVVAWILLPTLIFFAIGVVRDSENELLRDFPAGTFVYSTGIFWLVCETALSGWIVERWQGRSWVPALAVLSAQVPHLLAFPFYSVMSFQSHDESPWLVSLAALVTSLGPLVLLALLTAIAPQFGLPPLPRRYETCKSPSPG